MSHPDPLSQWIETVSTMLPKLSRPQAKVLAYWSYGMVLAKSCGITLVCAALALQVDSSEKRRLATLARMVLLCRRQKRGEASRTGREHVFCTVVAVDSGMVARRSATTGAGLGCDDLEETRDACCASAWCIEAVLFQWPGKWWGLSKREPGNHTGSSCSRSWWAVCRHTGQ